MKYIDIFIGIVFYAILFFFAPIQFTLIFTLCALIAFIALKLYNMTHYMQNGYIYTRLFYLSDILCILTACISISGSAHGLYDGHLTTKQVLKGVHYSPRLSDTDQDILNSPEGSIVVVYKFGCTDCEAVYADLNNAISDAKTNDIPVSWLSSRSEEGLMFLEDYPIDYVPTGIYIKRHADGNITYVQKRLNKNGKFDKANWDRLLELQKSGS